MSQGLPLYPFDVRREIGTISEVGPTTAKVNLPRASSIEGQSLHGHKVGAGEVGEFVIIDTGELGIFGRIVSIKLPEKERLAVEEEVGHAKEVHPLGTVQLLTAVSLKDGSVAGGISRYPRLGSNVFSAHPELVKWIAEATQRDGSVGSAVVLDLARLPDDSQTVVALTPDRLFGRHCAVLGTTGGGKSWTVARLIQEASHHNAKIILLDATGEFHTLQGSVKHVHIGSSTDEPENSTEVVLPYKELVEQDIYAIFKPSGQTQGPKLRAAIKSLKVIKACPSLGTDGVFIKARVKKEPFEKAYKNHSGTVERSQADFDISKLVLQIEHECVWPNGGTNTNPDPTTWGGANESERSYCISLLTRINDIIFSPELGCVFNPGEKTSIITEIDQFLGDVQNKVLHVSLKYLPFAHNAREIVANAIGRKLLAMARTGRFRNHPVLTVLDEAHQFLDKSLGDENTKYPLDSFELIAKEGRKFCLTICIATQRPRDIPEGVLSQMGTLLVHRLINDKDREVVERASGDIDRSAAAFLPTLGPGQAVIIGVDFAIPLTVQVVKPTNPPDSKGPNYQCHWLAKFEDAVRTETTSNKIITCKDIGG